MKRLLLKDAIAHSHEEAAIIAWHQFMWDFQLLLLKELIEAESGYPVAFVLRKPKP